VTAELAFALPQALEAAEPPEARGLARDAVRLMVAREGEPLVHARFLDLPRFLRPGDLLVVNESATLPAALKATRDDGTTVELHLSTPEPPPPGRRDEARAKEPPEPAEVGAPRMAAPADAGAPRIAAPAEVGAPLVAARPSPRGVAERWIVELRRGGARIRDARPGERLALSGGGAAELVAPYLSAGRLWVAALTLPVPLLDFLGVHGAPIRYAHQSRAWPLADHQTIFARVPGSAEMPSAGRPFSPRVLARLGAGIGVAPIVLHTGVSSLERGERPYAERFNVPASTAARVNAAHAAGGRVIAVGTTVTRALESAAAPGGTVSAASGWTSLTITPERGVRAVDGLITGWHEPDASHLLLLEAVAGRALVERSYAAAVEGGYRWHEFGDSHLLLRAA
jgi:S-adenosylmethionine:tRNA ribosyltransferase-isomerase